MALKFNMATHNFSRPLTQRILRRSLTLQLSPFDCYRMLDIIYNILFRFDLSIEVWLNNVKFFRYWNKAAWCNSHFNDNLRWDYFGAMFGTSNFDTAVTSVPNCGLRHQRLTSAASSIEMLTSAPWKSSVPMLMTCAEVYLCRSSFTRLFSIENYFEITLLLVWKVLIFTFWFLQNEYARYKWSYNEFRSRS